MIEELTSQDIPAAAEVYLKGLQMETPPGNSDVPSLVEKLRKVDGFIFKEEKVLGLITYTVKDKNIVLDFISSIVPRRGIGRNLMETLREFGKENTLEYITARESTEDEVAMGFYKALGFEKYGEQDEDGLLLNLIRLKV